MVTAATERKVERYMRSIASEYVDPNTGEVNSTGLAEDAADMYNLYDGVNPPEWLCDLAVEVAIAYERAGDGLVR